MSWKWAPFKSGIIYFLKNYLYLIQNFYIIIRLDTMKYNKKKLIQIQNHLKYWIVLQRLYWSMTLNYLNHHSLKYNYFLLLFWSIQFCMSKDSVLSVVILKSSKPVFSKVVLLALAISNLCRSVFSKIKLLSVVNLKII